MNKKGFTLVELLVSIAIMGLLSALAYPAIGNLIAKNKEKKYEYYAESLKQGAKLYIDSYSKDMWKENENGCKPVSYDELKKHYLIKDFDKNNKIVCSSSSTSVYVTKDKKNYSYDVALKCTQNGKTLYSKSHTNTSCTSGGTSFVIPNKPTITYTPSNWSKEKLVTLTSSTSGASMEYKYVVNKYDNDSSYPWSYNSSSKTWTSTNQEHSSTSTLRVNFILKESSTFSFNYNTISEANYDKLIIKDDRGNEIINVSGERSPVKYSINLTPGIYTYYFTYSKDTSVNYKNDAAYVSNITIGGTSIDSYSNESNYAKYDGPFIINNNTTLTARAYNVSGTSGEATANISKVDKIPVDTTAPTVSSTTLNSISVIFKQKDNAQIDTTTYEYGISADSCSGNFNWQKTSTFINLTAGKYYYIKTRANDVADNGLMESTCKTIRTLNHTYLYRNGEMINRYLTDGFNNAKQKNGVGSVSWNKSNIEINVTPQQIVYWGYGISSTKAMNLSGYKKISVKISSGRIYLIALLSDDAGVVNKNATTFAYCYATSAATASGYTTTKIIPVYSHSSSPVLETVDNGTGGYSSEHTTTLDISGLDKSKKYYLTILGSGVQGATTLSYITEIYMD